MNSYGGRIGAKMSKLPIIIVDADAIIAQANPQDIHHAKASVISQYMISLNAQVIYPVTAVAEAATHMQRVLNSTVNAYGTVQLMIDSTAQVVEVNKQTLAKALSYFSPTISKNNTVFDCIIAAIAEEYNADAIFSFDRFYSKKGFKLAEELK
jgi:predicted nucleic acid-binding protein